MRLKNVVVGEYIEAKHSEPLIGLTESSYYLVVAVDDSDEHSNVCINTEKFDGLWLSARDFRKAKTERNELTGNELCKAILDSGVNKVLVRVTDHEDVELKDTPITFAYKNDSGNIVTEIGCDYWAFITPINNQGEPLTAKDVGL